MAWQRMLRDQLHQIPGAGQRIRHRISQVSSRCRICSSPLFISMYLKKDIGTEMPCFGMCSWQSLMIDSSQRSEASEAQKSDSFLRIGRDLTGVPIGIIHTLELLRLAANNRPAGLRPGHRWL